MGYALAKERRLDGRTLVGKKRKRAFPAGIGQFEQKPERRKCREGLTAFIWDQGEKLEKEHGFVERFQL